MAQQLGRHLGQAVAAVLVISAGAGIAHGLKTGPGPGSATSRMLYPRAS